MQSVAMRVVATVIAAGWLAFWLYWLTAATGAKPGRSRWSRFVGVRVAIAVLIIVAVRAGGTGRHATVSSPVLRGIGLAVFVAGLLLAVWARVHIGRNWGMPMSRKVDPELVTTGPYRMIRHPIYTGILLGLLGTALALDLFGLIVVAVAGAYFVYSAVREERFMCEQFPDSYPRYQESTKMLIPLLF